MRTMRYLIRAGKLREQPVPGNQPQAFHGKSGESWFDVVDAGPEELSRFLEKLNLHPLQLKRCLDSVNDPGVISFGKSFLMEYPAAFNGKSADPAYLTIILKDSVLVTIRHGSMPALDDLARMLTAETAPSLLHLPQLIYMILDQFSDLNVEAQVGVRDQILVLSNTLDENPDAVSLGDLSRLRVKSRAWYLWWKTSCIASPD
jgi:Mg2+ and Co2+ transporter CorA